MTMPTPLKIAACSRPGPPPRVTRTPTVLTAPPALPSPSDRVRPLHGPPLPGRHCGPQETYDCGPHLGLKRGACVPMRGSSGPGQGAKWARRRTLCPFDRGAHGASAHLSAPIRVNPGQPKRPIPLHTQPHAVSSVWSPSMAVRAIFVPKFVLAGSPFFTSGLGGTASNPNIPPLPMHRWIDTAVLYVRCAGFAHAPATA